MSTNCLNFFLHEIITFSLVKVVKKLENALMTLWYFFTQEWYFASKNLINLHENMSEEDRKVNLLEN